jgi:hypothetical protein
MPELRSALFIVLIACGNAPSGDRPGPEDPCAVAQEMRHATLSQLTLPNSIACEADDDCVVIMTEVKCDNVFLGDCGTLVNRTVQSTLDWAHIERQICSAVEGTDFGCSANASCAAVAAPRCERGLCTQDFVAAEL